MDFGEQIKIYRKINNLSQQDIADLLGVTKQTISGWEKGKFSPPLSFVYEIAEKLNVSVNWLLGAEQKGTIESPKDPNLAIVLQARGRRFKSCCFHHSKTADTKAFQRFLFSYRLFIFRFLYQFLYQIENYFKALRSF